MKIEVLIYVYIAICLCVLAFSSSYILVDKGQKTRLTRKSRELEDKVFKQAERLKNGQEVEEAHKNMLFGRLIFLRSLEAFHSSLMLFKERDEKLLEEYLRQIRPVFSKLAGIYMRRDDIDRAYFAYLAEQYRLCLPKGSDSLTRFILELASSHSVYCRENALRALYASGNTTLVVSAYEQMNRLGIHHHIKLVVDGLARFQGDRQELAERLWGYSGELDDEWRLAVMQFIRMVSDQFCGEFFAMLTDEMINRELRFEAIRYFRKYFYKPAGNVLINFVSYSEVLDWEYAALAASALGNYPGPQTILALKQALASRNWYIRFNAAETLVDTLKVPYLELADIYNGEDRYAREILDYMMDRHKRSGKAEGK